MRRWPGSTGPAYLAILLAGMGLIALTWVGTLSALHTEKRAAVAHANAELANMALLFENQVRRRLFAVDQTLRILEDEWERDPAAFNLASWQRRARVIADPGVEIYLTDAKGIIRLSSRPELIGVDLSSKEGFKDRAMLTADDGRLFIGAEGTGQADQPWHIGLARRLDTHEGRFAGIIGLLFGNGAIVSFFNTAQLGPHGMIALVDTRDGQVLASAGAEGPAPGSDIADSPLSDAMQHHSNGFWTGAIVEGGGNRMCALGPVMNRPLEVVLCVDPAVELAAHYDWQRSARIFAGCITLLLLFIMAALSREARAARLREEGLARDRLALEEVNAREVEARELAEANAAQIAAILVGISDGVSVVDADMRLRQWNAQFSHYTGVPAEMLRVGLPMADMLRSQAKAGEFGKVDVEAEVARRMAMLRSGSFMGVLERARPDGHILEMRRSPLPDGGFVTLYADITERKQAERALERAREIAEAAAADKSRFVAIVSHEIRTPLNTLLSALMMLHAGDLPPGERGILGVARQSGDALLGLLDDILEMSRADAGQLALRPAVFALRPLLEGVLEIFRDQAAARSLVLRLELAPGIPETLYTDAGRLRQVLMNLVSNAVKYSRPGAIVLEAVPLVAMGRTSLRLGLHDRGPAIGVADRVRLFQPFSRLEPHGSPLKPGTGLGLVICQRLTMLMGGEIGYREEPPDCNEFWITLPVVDAPEGAASLTPTSRLVPRFLPRTRVLLVDDIAANRTIVATLLRREGHKVDVAGSGEAAVAAARRTPYDVVLMDVLMPGMNGLDATRALHALGGIAGSVPVVALTANTGPEERANCLAAGMKDMLTKPADMPALREAIARYVWSGRRTARLDGFEPLPPRPVAATLAVATPAVDEPRLTELRANLPPDLLADLVDQCLRDIAVRLPALKNAVASGAVGEIETHAHAIAGMAASYAMAALESRLRRVLQAARNADPAGARRAAIGLDQDLARTDAAFRTLFALAPA